MPLGEYMPWFSGQPAQSRTLPTDTFRPLIVTRDFSQAFDRVTKALVEARREAEDKLTEQQLIEAMRQAITCGDFLRLCSVGESRVVDGRFTYEQRQVVVYEPYREVESLKTRIRELELELDMALRAINPLEE